MRKPFIKSFCSLKNYLKFLPKLPIKAQTKPNELTEIKSQKSEASTEQESGEKPFDLSFKATLHREKECVNIDNYFTKIDPELRVIFKFPVFQLLYMYWLNRENSTTKEGLENHMHYFFLAELLLYNEVSEDLFCKLCLQNYPEIGTVFDLNKMLKLLSLMLNDIKPFVVKNMDKAKVPDIKTAEPEKIILDNYYKYVDIRIRPFFKSKECQELFENWLEIEGIGVYESLVEHQHNVFIEELVYYYKKGPAFFKSIIPNIYRKFEQRQDFPRALDKITLMFEAFSGLVDETMNDIKKKFGTDVDKSKLLSYGMDFGMIILHILKRDPLNALAQAKSFLGDVGELIKAKSTEKKIKAAKETEETNDKKWKANGNL